MIKYLINLILILFLFSCNEVDLNNVFETDDNTDLSGELACSGGSCEVV